MGVPEGVRHNEKERPSLSVRCLELVMARNEDIAFIKNTLQELQSGQQTILTRLEVGAFVSCTPAGAFAGAGSGIR